MSYVILGDNLNFFISNEEAVREILIEADPMGADVYEEIFNDPDLPQKGDSHPTKPLLKVEKLTLEPHPNNSTNTLALKVYYALSQSPYDEDVPWLRPPKYKVTSLSERVPTQMYYDPDGNLKANVNSAGDLFPEYDTLRTVRHFEILCYFPEGQSPAIYDSLIGSINKNQCQILGRSGTRCFYLEDIRYETKYYINEQLKEKIPYYEVTFLIQYDPENFQLRQWDEGLRELNSDNKLQEVKWLNSSGKLVQPLKPVKLDGTGKRLTDAAQSDPTQWCVSSTPRHHCKPMIWYLKEILKTEV